MKILFLSFMFYTGFISCCNSAENRRSLIEIFNRTAIEEKLEILWTAGFENEDDVSAKAYAQFNSLMNRNGSIHDDEKVRKILFRLELTDSEGKIPDYIRAAWENKVHVVIKNLTSFKFELSTTSDDNKENKENNEI